MFSMKMLSLMLTLSGVGTVRGGSRVWGQLGVGLEAQVGPVARS